jgi:integrase/recombinase XerC
MASKRSTRPAERAVKYLTQDQVRRFFNAIPKEAVRDRLLFAFIYRYALRTQEACELPAESVDRSRNEVRVQGLKNGLRRTYPLFRDLRTLVRGWKPTSSTYFNGRQGPLTRGRVWQLFKQYAEAAGLPEGYGVHSLRHSAAVHLLDAEGTIEEARDLLRHRHVATTEVYADLSVNRRNRYLSRLEDSPKVVKLR